MESRKIVFRETAVVLVGQALCIGIMLAVFAMLRKFDITVLLGGLMGGLLAVGNFFFMAVAATLAADRAEQQDVEGGKKLMKASYPVRLLVLAVILIACIKSGWFHVLSLVLPLAFTRPILTMAEFFKKKGA